MAQPGTEVDPDEHQAVVRLVEAWVAEPTGNLIVTGPIGTGKTYLAAAACRALAERGRFCWARSVGLFIDDCKPGGPGIGQHLQADILLLDDIGSGRGEMTPFEEDRLFTLVNERWVRRRLSVVTTNLSAQAPAAGRPSPLELYLGTRINDRLRHESLILALTGRSRRKSRWRKGGP